MTKAELRLKYLSLRAEIPLIDLEESSLAIANLILTMDIWQYDYFHLFLPITTKKEVNTEFLLHILSGKDKNIVLSKADFVTRTMHHYLLTDGTTIISNKYGIPEPKEGLEVPLSKIDVVFVPLLAFDFNGNRVGYGKGFYDKFLAECPHAIKIGLCVFEAENKFDGVLDTDVVLDFCVTPTSIYKF